MLDSRRVAGAALLLVPAGLIAFFAFNSGGFYPGPPAYAAVLLSVVLALRMILGGNPFAAFSPWLAAVAGAFALYVLLTLLSQIWSHAPGRALVEFDRALVYLLVMVLFGSVAQSRERLVWLLRATALVIVAVCVSGLITRLLPHLWPTTAELANNRLSFPVTYWNALGLVGAFGTVLCLHLSSDPLEPLASRVLAAAAVPPLAATVFFTFSRGGIAAAIIGLVVYLLIARPRSLPGAAIAIVPTTAIAIKVAYDANLLATVNPTTPGAVAQGRHVAVVVLVCTAGAGILRAGLGLTLDRALDRVRLRPPVRARIRQVGWSALAAGVVIAVVALHGQISTEYHGFVHGTGVGNANDFRTRLTDPSNNGRLELWRVAWHQVKRTPWLGQGAGTFQNTWAQHRPDQNFVVDTHSLYLETLDELGIVGTVLLIGVMVAVLIRTAMRARGPNRPLYAAIFALMLMWALHASIDWDWEMPAVTLPFFALAGTVLARPVTEEGALDGRATATRGLSTYGRTILGIGCLLIGVAPAYLWLSQRRLDQATAAFATGDCRLATSSALGSISVLGDRPEPYEVISYCDIRRDMPDMAIAMINKAISLDPNNWNYRYDLAVMRASAGLNPMAAAHKALSLDPREPLVQQMVQTFAGGDRASWESNGKQIAEGFTTL